MDYHLLNILLFTLFFPPSDVAVELPFMLMHPKPVEDSIYKDGVLNNPFKLPAKACLLK